MTPLPLITPLISVRLTATASFRFPIDNASTRMRSSSGVAVLVLTAAVFMSAVDARRPLQTLLYKVTRQHSDYTLTPVDHEFLLYFIL